MGIFNLWKKRKSSEQIQLTKPTATLRIDKVAKKTYEAKYVVQYQSRPIAQFKIVVDGYSRRQASKILQESLRLQEMSLVQIKKR